MYISGGEFDEAGEVGQDMDAVVGEFVEAAKENALAQTAVGKTSVGGAYNNSSLAYNGYKFLKNTANPVEFAKGTAKLGLSTLTRGML